MTNATNTVPIDLVATRVVCPQHGEPFRAAWPRGYPVFAVEIVRAVVSDAAFLDECRQRSGVASSEDVPPEAIERALDARPACCRLAVAVLRSAYERCGVGRTGRCVNCRAKRAGTPYRIRDRRGTVVDLPHVCFECVLAAEPREN